ncbi:MAG: hypothetical protein LBU16_10420 [Treponema sp.]|jgi:hypothetical protein|nr:hypothetical protein [Treponema sp.]
MKERRRQRREPRGICSCSSVRFVVNILEHSGFAVEGVRIDSSGCHHIEARPLVPVVRFQENLQKELRRMGYPS